MATRQKYWSLMLLPVLLLSGFRCTNEAKLLEQIPESSFIDNCPDVLHPFGDMVTVADPNEKFAIWLPYSWDIRESYGDSLYGVFASNFMSIPIPMEERMAISISGYSTVKDLEQYVRDELVALVKDDNTTVLERGSSMFNGRSNPWVLFEMKSGIFNMVYYLKEPGKEDIFLIQSVTYDTVNYRNKLCHLKQLINSFEWMKY